jgi:hypothetical protein
VSSAVAIAADHRIVRRRVYVPAEVPSSKWPSAICPCTGLAIPECSCRRCLEEQMRTFSPPRRERRAVSRLRDARREPPAEGRAAA